MSPCTTRIRSGADAKLVGDKLRERGAQALTVRTGADPQFDKPGRVHRQLDRFPAERHAHAARGEGRRAVAGALGEGRKADAEIAAFRAGALLTLAEAGRSSAFTAMSSVCR